MLGETLELLKGSKIPDIFKRDEAGAGISCAEASVAGKIL